MTDASPWDEAPRHLLPDRARIGPAFVRRRIIDHPTAPRSPWQNGLVKKHRINWREVSIT